MWIPNTNETIKSAYVKFNENAKFTSSSTQEAFDDITLQDGTPEFEDVFDKDSSRHNEKTLSKKSPSKEGFNKEDTTEQSISEQRSTDESIGGDNSSKQDHGSEDTEALPIIPPPLGKQEEEDLQADVEAARVSNSLNQCHHYEGLLVALEMCHLLSTQMQVCNLITRQELC
jgi:hypothetical protein